MEKKDPIKDGEFESYLRITYRYKLEEELLRTKYGRRIKELEKLGIGISFGDVIDKYQEKSGYTFDNVGNIKIEEDSISEIYVQEISEASKRIGFDISNLNTKQISQVLSQLEYVQDVKDVRVDEIATSTEKQIEEFNDILKFLDIEESKYVLDKNTMQENLVNLNIPLDLANRYVKEYEENSINTFLSTFSDVNLVRGLAILSYVLKNNQYTNLDTEIEAIQQLLMECKDSKFIKQITDENGNFDLEKGLKFFKEFKGKREEVDLDNKINRYNTPRKKLTQEDEKNLADIFVLGFAKGNELQKKTIEGIAKANRLDILDKNGELDKSKIEEYGRRIYGKDFSFDIILERNSFEGQIALDELSDIEKSIEKGYTHPNPQSVEEVNKIKDKSNKENARLCSEKEKIVFDVLNSQNALNFKFMKDHYKKPENAKALILLFCKFREEEIIENNPQRTIGFNERSINSGRDDTISGIIKKYIRENEEAFKEYLKSDGSLDAKKVMEVVRANDLDANRSANNLIAYDQIKSKTSIIRMLESDNNNKKKVKDIERLLKKDRKEKLSEEEKDELFTLAKNTSIYLISTDELEALKEIDEERFKETFKGKNVEKKVNNDTLGAIYFSATKVFMKGLYALPKMLISKKAREEFMPKITKHVKSGAKRVGKLILDSDNVKKENNLSRKEKKSKRNFKFLNIFRKKGTKLLESGEISDETKNTTPVDKATSRQQSFDEYLIVNNENGQIEKGAAEVSKTITEKEEKTDETSRTEEMVN